MIKPDWGLKSLGVELVEDEPALERLWTASHRVVQTYIPEAARCTRILVIGGRAVFAVTRVARDGFHATYDHGRLGTLEPYPLLREREALAQAACRAVGVEVAGVDLVETAQGPCILEVNHICVEFGDRDLHGPEAVLQLSMWLAERARRRIPVVRPNPRIPRLRIVTDATNNPVVSRIRDVCDEAGFASTSHQL